MTMQKEINDMLTGYLPQQDPPPAEPSIEPQTPPVEPSAAEPPVTPPPVEPPVAPPTVEPPPQSPPQPPLQEPPPQVPPEEDKDAIIAALRAQIAEMAGVSGAPDLPMAAPGPAPAPVADPAQPQGPPQPPSQPIADIQFVESEEALDGILNTKESFNKFMTGVYNRAKTDAQEGILRAVPQLVINLANQQINLRAAVTEFYANNEDLRPYKAFVGFVANDIAAKNPDWTLDKVVSELGGEARRRLSLSQVAGAVPGQPGGPQPQAQSQPGQPGGPAFVPPTGGGRRGQGPGGQLSQMQKEISDLIS